MTKEIVILRESIKKLVPMLAGRGLVVTQIGTGAYVAPNPVTGLPARVNIPSIPDNAESAFISAIQGFIDHECSHVLYTDFLVGRGVKTVRLHELHNAVEDTMIERRMGEDFPGARKNIARLRDHFLAKITQPALDSAKDDKERFQYLLIVALRAMAGHEEMQRFMDAGNHWQNPFIAEMIKQMKSATIAALPTLTKTTETYEVAQELEAIIYPPPPPAPPQPSEPEESDDEDKSDEDQDDEQGSGSDSSEGESEDKPEKEAGEGDGDGERDHSEQEEQDGKGEGEEDGEGDESSDTEGDGAGDEKEDDDAAEGEGSGSEEEDAEDGSDADQVDEADPSGDSDGEDEGEEDQDQAGDTDAGEDAETNKDDAGEGEQGDQADDQDETSDQDDDGDDGDQSEASGDGDGSDDADGADGAEDADGDDDGEDSGSDEPDAGGEVDVALEIESDHYDKEEQTEAEKSDDHTVGGVGYAGPSIFDNTFDDDDLKDKDMSRALCVLIQKEVIESINAADYSVFTRDYDRIEPLKVPEKFNSKHVAELDDKTNQMTGVMQKEIERMMAAQSRVFNYGGQRSGRLNGPALHRAAAGDPRIFARKEEIRAKDTAVTLLVDCSGSMGGHNKIETAMMSAYALCQTLTRVAIPNEVLGFTTWHLNEEHGPWRRKDMEEFNDERVKEPNFYGFCRVEPLYMPIFKDFDKRLDADAKRRFAYMPKARGVMMGNIDGESLEYAAIRLLKRREQRKVMIVLSDGHPAGARNDAEHLRMMTSNLTKIGIDLVGIGIRDASVSRFYDKYLVLNDVNDLPTAVMKELRQILTK